LDMKTYKYIARDFSGSKKEGTREAASSNDVLGYLREQGCIPVFVEEVQEKAAGNTPKNARRRRIKSSDLSAFCWQFSTMIEGGISITAALETIADDMDNLYFREVLQNISASINKGESVLSAVSKYPNVFNRLSRAIILAGETSGNLSAAIKRLAVYYENRDKLVKQVRTATAYPIFVVSFIVVILIVIMTFIIPRFRVMFEQFGSKLPVFTQVFLRVYDMICHNILIITGLVFFVIMGIYFLYTKSKMGHRIMSILLLRLPLLGRVFSQSFISIYCRTMSTLLEAGVSVLEVFDILSEMTQNDVIRDAIVKTKGNVVEGQGIASSMSRTPFFPNMVVKMTQVGEESGSMPAVLDKTADYYERKVEATIHTITTLIEPIMIVTIGVIVLVVVLALYLPIFSLSDFSK
jgi:type IV pilus assembly protein PilC